MKLLIILAIIYIIIGGVLLVFFTYQGPKSFAWGHRIQKRTYNNGKSEYFIQQRVPLVFIWLTCSSMIGIDTYASISFDTELKAKEYLKDFHERVKVQKGLTVNKKENIEL